MKKIRRTEVTCELHEVWVIRRLKGSTQGFCESCVNQAVMLSPREAAHVSRVTERTIYRLVEAGSLHFTEKTDGEILICAASLSFNIS